MDKIREGNQLIMEFMDINDTYEFADNIANDPYLSEEWVNSGKPLLFQRSWDWIMPVLKKISDHGCIVEISYCLVTSCRICVIGGKDEKAFNIMYNNNDGSQSIAPVWDAVVEYLTYLKSKAN